MHGLALGLSDVLSTSVASPPPTVMEAPGRAPGTSIWLVMDGHRVVSTGALPCPVPSRWSCWQSSGWQTAASEMVSILGDVTQLALAIDRRGLDSYKLWMRPSSSLVCSVRSLLWERVRLAG